MVKISNGKIEERYLVKPSGPLNAILSFVWHYPTFRTQKGEYGHVMDRTNPCLKFQYDKVGPNPYVRTSDRYPFRTACHKHIQHVWETTFTIPYLMSLQTRCDRFQRWMNKHSRFLVFVGRENFETYSRMLDLDKTFVQTEQVPLHIPNSYQLLEKRQCLQVPTLLCTIYARESRSFR
ncbi:hypothetical protein F4819DRAFT_435020 [Hypoxylon fuscum]|nr:hypothetical protein F4819DRAFT_435020 [Hypoxylon fuscum]